jgi:hypothetical protein
MLYNIINGPGPMISCCDDDEYSNLTKSSSRDLKNESKIPISSLIDDDDDDDDDIVMVFCDILLLLLVFINSVAII